MSLLRKKLTELQNKPYATRVRILRFVVILLALLLILIWILTLRYRSPDTAAPSFNSKFTPFWEEFKKLKSLKFR